MFLKIGVFENIPTFTGKLPVFNRVTGLKACNIVKNKLQRRCFRVNIAKFLKTAILTEHLWWILLKILDVTWRRCDCIRKSFAFDILILVTQYSVTFCKILCGEYRFYSVPAVFLKHSKFVARFQEDSQKVFYLTIWSYQQDTPALEFENLISSIKQNELAKGNKKLPYYRKLCRLICRLCMSYREKKTSLKLTSHDILLYLWSVDLSKSFCQLIVSIFIFLNQQLIIFSHYSLDSKVWSYRTLLTSWFINFKLTQINLT